MRLTWEAIAGIVFGRMSADLPLINQMQDTCDRYYGRMIVPITNAPNEPDMPSLSPQVIQGGIDGTALRAASQTMVMTVPALDPHKDTGKGSTAYARIRQSALYASWDFNMLQLLGYRAYRHLVGYGTLAMVVMPDFEEKRAVVELRNPLNAYPEPRAHEDLRPPRNAAFVYGRSRDWLKEKYGSQVQGLFDLNQSTAPDVLWDVVEWIDEHEIVIGVLGPRDLTINGTSNQNIDRGVGTELRRYPNRAGFCTVAAPRRITLDRVAGQLDAVTGQTDWLDRLMALNTIAAEKSIFADLYALGEDGREPGLVGGEWVDGRTGKMNLLKNTSKIGTLAPNGSNQAMETLSLLERNARVSGGTIPQMAGENPNSMRTGRGLDTMAAFSIDPRIAEMHEMYSSMVSRVINPSIMEIEKGYWPTNKYVVFSGWPSDTGYVEYTPSEHYETTSTSVKYPFPGSDVTDISVAVLQLTGGGLMSKKTARHQHPMIWDESGEEDAITAERLDDGLLVSVQEQISQGSLPVGDAAAIRQKVAEGAPLYKAVLDVQKEAQERQASQPEIPQTPEGEPDFQAPPDAMPGLAPPGAGQEAGGLGLPPGAGPSNGGPDLENVGTAPQGVGTINPPANSQQRLKQLLYAIRQK